MHQQYPGINFEVVNVAMTASNSHITLDIAKECAKHQGDLIVVYLGNNEVIGPYGVGTVFAPLSSNMSFIRFDKALKTTKLGQLLTHLSRSINKVESLPKEWGGLQMFMKNLVRADNPHLQIVYQHYKKNLEDIRRIACKNSIKIIFSTVGSNLKDCPPFACLHRDDLKEAEKKKWDEIYQQAIEYETQGKYFKEVKRYLEAAGIDDSFANLQFRLARCYLALAEYDKAHERYIKARELDTLRFRADNEINKIISDVAKGRAEQGVYFVDAVNVFEKNSTNNIPGEELFYDHVHLNFKGNYLLAKTVFEQVEKILPQWAESRKAKGHPLPSEVECARRIAYTEWDRHVVAKNVMYIKDAPFNNRLGNKELVKRIEKKIRDLETSLSPESLKESVAHYQKAIQELPSDICLRWQYAQLLWEGFKDYHNSASQCKLLTDLVPHEYWYSHLGLYHLTCTGDISASITNFLKAIELNPVRATTYRNLALACEKQGLLDEAISHFRRALQIDPKYAEAHNDLGGALKEKGLLDEAISHFRRALQIDPDYVGAYNNLGNALKAQGNLDEAIEHYRRALQIDPGYAKAHFNLGVAMEGRGELGQTIEHYRKGLEIEPDDAKAHFSLGVALATKGELDEAISHYRRALQIDPHYFGAYYNLGNALKAKGELVQAIKYYQLALQIKPDWIGLMNNLAWLLATHQQAELRDPREAVRLAERACELTGYVNPGILDTLAVVYAAAGRPSEAVTTAEKALELARSSQQEELASEIQKHLDLFKAGKAYVETSVE